MKKWAICLAIAGFILASLVGDGLAADKATATQLKEKATAAAKMLAEKGQAGLAEINDAKSSWAQEPYVFVYDLKGNVVAHPNPKLVGKNFLALKDVKGNMFPAEFQAIGLGQPGHGWVEYWWPKLGEKAPSQKVTYVARVPGQDLIVCVGEYDISKEQALQEAGD
ncbi:MAG: cache domain-containing protein [Deltaproteobacteria bacterium]|nr:cache domain-containing protein [Deltaproteobacteria bacterium]